MFRSTIVWDNHACMPLRTDASFLPQLERYRAAGVNVVSLNVGFADITWPSTYESCLSCANGSRSGLMPIA